MWILPSRSRPASLKRFFEQYHKTRATSEGVVWVDQDDPKLNEYQLIELPPKWLMVIRPAQEGAIGGIINTVFHMFPDKPWYGLLADDLYPRTYKWDIKLIEAAGNDGLSYGDDLINGEKHASHPCIGGDLVRKLGWLSLPGLERIYIDNALMEAARKYGHVTYLPGVITEHLHFSNGKSPVDDVYRKPTASKDMEIYNAWLATL